MVTIRPLRCASLLSVLLVLLARQTKAQMNAEPLRQELNGDGVGAHVAESISGFAGNTSGIVVGLGVLLGARSGRQFGYFNASADYTRLAGETLMAKAFTYVRTDYELSPFLWSELFGQMEADRIRRIALRELLGAGPRILLIRSRNAMLFFGTSYVLEYTRLRSDQAAVASSSVAHRWSNYLEFTWTIGKSTTLGETFYVQPRFDALSDMHTLSVTSLQFKLTSHLSSHIDTIVRYDTRQIPETKQFDITVKNMLDLRF